MLGVAVRLFSNEQLVNPSWEPISVRSLRGGKGGPRVRRLPAPDAALAIFAFSLLLTFYVQPSMQNWGLLPMVGVTEIFLVAGPAILVAWLAKYKWKETFGFRPCGAREVNGAWMLAVGLAICLGMVHWVQNLFWPGDARMGEMMEKLFGPALAAHPILTVVAVGVLAGVCEELLFRGPVQAGLLRRLPVWFALGLGAMLFALAHLDLHGAPIRFGLGVILGYVVWRGGSIWPAMILHGVYDSFQIALAAALDRWPAIGNWIGMSPTSGELFNAYSFARLGVGILLVWAGWKMMKMGWGSRKATPGESPSTTQIGAVCAAI